MSSFIENIPKSLSEQAFVDKDEAAWPRDAAMSVISYLSQLGIAVIGGEIWLPTKPGPTIPMPYFYGWDSGSRNDNESWNEYVVRANEVAKEYVTSFEWAEEDTNHAELLPYFNFTVEEEQPKQINNLERELLETLLAGDDSFLQSLRSQLEQSVIENKVLTGSGFFVYFTVPTSVPRVSSGRILVDDVRFDLDGLEHGGEGILFVDDGHIHIFEGYLHSEDWPDEPKLTRVFYDTDPRDFKLLRKAWGVE